MLPSEAEEAEKNDGLFSKIINIDPVNREVSVGVEGKLFKGFNHNIGNSSVGVYLGPPTASAKVGVGREGAISEGDISLVSGGVNYNKNFDVEFYRKLLVNLFSHIGAAGSQAEAGTVSGHPALLNGSTRFDTVDNYRKYLNEETQGVKNCNADIDARLGVDIGAGVKVQAGRGLNPKFSYSAGIRPDLAAALRLNCPNNMRYEFGSSNEKNNRPF